ncbi:GDAP2 [Cordylochernes scorpioides]|uniref:GDAP2 n=1 Tax=Cordylochernes scorpioides TaxID=51811 RepID=A0ABY6L9D1_9ARAC|nr:GDAP2 [Cordylochernes scorpioides]
MDFDSYADADNDVVTNAMLSDVEIVESILQAKEEEETDQVDEEVDPIVHIPHPKELWNHIPGNGDISTLSCDAIVHTTNESFKEKSPITDKILQRAGPQLREDLAFRLKDTEQYTLSEEENNEDPSFNYYEVALMLNHFFHPVNQLCNSGVVPLSRRVRVALSYTLFKCEK